MINLCDGWCIDSDNYNVILMHKYVNKNDEVAFNLHTYHKDVRSALLRFQRRMEEEIIQHDMDPDGFIKAYDKIALKIEDTINKIGGELDDYRKAGQSEEDPEELL